TGTGAAAPNRPLPLQDRFNSIGGQIRVLPIPKIGERARGRIPSADAVAAHPKDAANIFKDGIHRLIASPEIWFGEVIVVAPITPMSGGVRRPFAAKHSEKAAFACGEPHVAAAIVCDPIYKVIW